MMKKTLFLFLLLPSLLHAQVSRTKNVVDHVNPLMGTASKHEFSNGNTYPAIALPWGMNFWTPQTGPMGNGWAYTYDSSRIVGFKQTHQPSPWINDYGQFALMPATGKLVFKETDRASWFSHKAEESRPYYYKVYLADHDVVTEITPTERAAFFRFTYPQTDSAFLVIDALDKGSFIRIYPNNAVSKVIPPATAVAYPMILKTISSFSSINLSPLPGFTRMASWCRAREKSRPNIPEPLLVSKPCAVSRCRRVCLHPSSARNRRHSIFSARSAAKALTR